MNNPELSLNVFKRMGRRKVALSIIIILTLLGLLVTFGPLDFGNNTIS
jgi:hypothetical protein